jgi:TonB family protein
MVRRFRLLGACLAAASPLLAPWAAAAAEPVRWHTEVEVQRLAEEIMDDPASASFSRGWSSPLWKDWVTAKDLAARFPGRSVFNESFLVVDSDPTGKAIGCRPLRASAAPDLDSFGCSLLLARAAFPPRYGGPGRPVAAKWVMAIRWESWERDRPLRIIAPPAIVPFAPPAPPAPPPSPPGANLPWPRLHWSDALTADFVPDARAAYRRPPAGPKAGRVSLDLLLDAAKGITDCRIGVSSGSAQLDEAACALARQVRLSYRRPCDACWADTMPLQIVWDPKESRIVLPLASPYGPARGTGVRTYAPYRQPYPFQLNIGDFAKIPDRTVSKPKLDVLLAVDESGKVSDCWVARSSGNDAVDARVCALLVKRGRFTVRTDIFGNPIANRLRTQVDLRALQ